MLFIGAEDFFTQASAVPRLSREEEISLAKKMAEGDQSARQTLVRSYFPMVAGVIRRGPKAIQTLRTVYACIAELEKGVDGFNFLQDSEPFTHHLSRRLRQCIARAIADRIS